MVSLEKETPAKKLEVEVGHAKLHKEREGMEREIDRVLTLLTKFVGNLVPQKSRLQQDQFL